MEDKKLALKEALEVLKPSTLVLGTEFESSQDIEIKESIKLMKKNRKEVQFHAGAVQYASTELLNNSKNELLKLNKNKFLDACKRQHININELGAYVDCFKDSKLLVIGDTILDQYAGCEAMGMSAEAPVLVVRELQKEILLEGQQL